MGKKSKQKKQRQEGHIERKVSGSSSSVVYRKPEIPAFWIAIIIPVICLVGAWTFPPVATPMELKSYWSQIYLSGLLFFTLWFNRHRTLNSLSFSPARACLGMLFIVGTLSLVWAVNPDFWVYKWNKWYAALVMFLLGIQITQNEKNFDTVVNLALLGGLITACIGIAQYLFGFNLIPQTSFPSSTFGNGNMAGQVMVLTMLLPLYFLFKENLTTGKTWFYALSLAVLMTYVYYTRTRAIWIASTLEWSLLIIFISLDRSGRKKYLFWTTQKTIAATCAGIIFCTLTNFNQDGFQPFWEIAMYEISSIAHDVGASAQETGGERYLIWSSAIKMVADHPFFGTGLGSYFHNVNNVQAYANYRTLGVQRVHNDVLELCVELGALGILILLSFIIAMCILLFKLIQKSEGKHRILYAILTILVTGSMLNAQLSFPYQLPVPLIIMPFYLSLIIKGSELLLENTFTIPVKAWFKKASLAAAGAVFIFITIIDLSWFRDIHVMNKMLNGELSGEDWDPISPVYNQAYFTTVRSVGQALRPSQNWELTLHLFKPIVEFWPNSPANILLVAESYYSLGNYDEAIYWSRKTAENQPAGTFLGEFYLIQSYFATNQLDKMKEVYDTLRSKPEAELMANENTYRMLQSTSINLGDYENSTYFYEKYLEHFGEDAQVVANEAIHFYNTGNLQAAIPYMQRAIELDPALPVADQFMQLLMQMTPQ